MADIFDEVSEDLRKDQYKQIWFKYKKFIISFVLIVVFSIVAFKLIEFYQEKKKIETATLYFDGLQEIKNKNYEKAEVLFKKLIEDANEGYTVLSYFKLANINLIKKDFQSMEMYYDKIMSLENINKAYRDYALILKITNSPNIKNDDKALDAYNINKYKKKDVEDEIVVASTEELTQKYKYQKITIISELFKNGAN